MWEKGQKKKKRKLITQWFKQKRTQTGAALPKGSEQRVRIAGPKKEEGLVTGGRAGRHNLTCPGPKQGRI